jgi:hypothetical protein
MDVIKRKKHFVVEIPAKAASRHLHSNSNKQQPATETTVTPGQSIARPPPQPAPQRPPVAKANRPNTAGNAAVVPPPRPPVSETTGATNTTNLTKHKEKVANGLKHELDRLQPDKAVTKEQGRKLRSQGATRFKSELSAYFPDYDEVIGNDPKEYRE